MTKLPEHFPAKTELDGGPILEPQVDQEALKRAKAIIKAAKRKRKPIPIYDEHGNIRGNIR